MSNLIKMCEDCNLAECISCEHSWSDIKEIKQQLAEKDKEIAELKDKLKRTEKAMHEEVKEHLEYYNADQKYLRHEICEKIKECSYTLYKKGTKIPAEYHIVAEELDEIKQGDK